MRDHARVLPCHFIDAGFAHCRLRRLNKLIHRLSFLHVPQPLPCHLFQGKEIGFQKVDILSKSRVRLLQGGNLFLRPIKFLSHLPILGQPRSLQRPNQAQHDPNADTQWIDHRSWNGPSTRFLQLSILADHFMPSGFGAPFFPDTPPIFPTLLRF